MKLRVKTMELFRARSIFLVTIIMVSSLDSPRYTHSAELFLKCAKNLVN